MDTSQSARISRRTFLAAVGRKIVCAGVLGVSALLTVVAAVNGQDSGSIPFVPFIPNGTLFPNPSGASETYSTIAGGIDQTGPFFQSLGTNGRSCGSCHQPSDGMSVSAANVQALSFAKTPSVAK